jgi:hypothetical protein
MIQAANAGLHIPHLDERSARAMAQKVLQS